MATGLWLIATALAADESATAPRNNALAASCNGCHHPNAQFETSVPSLHPLSAAEITTKLQAFRDGRTQGTVMNRIAKGYTPAELTALGKALGKPP